MPEYDGVYGIKHIRAKDPHAKIIVVTGNHVNDSYPELQALKPSAVFYKPFEIDNIIKSVNELTTVAPK